jgi:nicotinamide-nucleotide amidase
MIERAELVSTGAELLSGRSVNTHARLLGERLRAVGIELVRDTTVPDGLAVIRDAVAAALQRVELVFVSGGLGPTVDDLTRDALAELLGCGIVTDAAALAEMTERMERAGRVMNAARRRQALVVEGAEVLLNRVGAAPGQRLTTADGKTVFLLPGPPNEFRYILGEYIEPWLRREQAGAGALRERLLLTQGIGESDIVQRFELAGFPPDGVMTAYCAGAGRVEVRLEPAGPEVADAVLDAAAEEAARLLVPYVYARERVALEDVIGRLLAERGQTLATAESCTGGMIGARLTAVPGSSVYYWGGVVAYADAVKAALLGVDEAVLRQEGAVSEPVAAQMADGVRQRLGADYGVSVTGIAGPGGGSAEKPVGLVYVGVADAAGVQVERFVYPGDRESIREATSRAALALLYRRLVS